MSRKPRTTKGRRTLTELRQEINDAYEKFQDGIRTTVDRARRLGVLLIEVKHALPHGKFQTWVQDNCPFGPSAARDYMTIAENWDKIKQIDELRYKALGSVVNEIKGRKPKDPGHNLQTCSFDRMLSKLEERLSEVAAVHPEISDSLDLVESIRTLLKQHGLLSRAPRTRN